MLEVFQVVVSMSAMIVLGAIIILSPIILSGIVAMLLPLEGENKENDEQ